MKKKFPLLILLFLPLSLSAIETYHEATLGYGQDLSVSMGLRIEDSSQDFPLFVQGRMGYTYQKDPGNAELARKIFINDNQGGTIQKYGESYQLAIDLGWKAHAWDKFSLELTLSGIWNHYRANFAFIGNNEAFTVKTSPLGMGAGAALRLPLSGSGSFLTVKSGLEYFPKTLIVAHGTYYYSPDSLDDNPRNSYTYEDADGSINQPDLRGYVMIGILYPLGI